VLGLTRRDGLAINEIAQGLSTIDTVKPEEALAIEANLFPHVRGFVGSHPRFPWHRDRANSITAARIVSSQALAVDVFGTVDLLPSREAIVTSWIDALGLTLKGPWKIELEAPVPAETLGEPRSTQIDALARGAAGLIVFECKFMETDGGACSQTRPIASGRHRGVTQCNGNYEDQINPVNQARSHCALSGKGIRYWELVPEVLDVDPRSEHRPCPFVGGWYQWMRNLVAARELGRLRKVPSAFVVVYADGPFPMAKKVTEMDWARLAAAVSGRTVPLRWMSYQRLLDVALKVASPDDRRILHDLSMWVIGKVNAAATGR
jgi:hypothetical protein